MNDLISRQAAIDAIADYLSKTTYTSAISFQNTGAMILARVPSAQPKRKKGKWIMHIDNLFPEDSTIECNQCHEHQLVNIDDNFCPNCGAEMVGDCE